MGKKLTVLDQLKTSMARAKGWASNQVAQVAQAAAEAMEEMDAVKADKSEGVAVTIPATGWSQDSGAYPYYYDIAASATAKLSRWRETMGMWVALISSRSTETV